MAKKVKVDKAVRKEANQLRYRQLNGHLGAAKVAHGEKAPTKVLESLRSAYALTVTPTVWASEQKRVKTRAKSYNVTVKALTE